MSSGLTYFGVNGAYAVSNDATSATTNAGYYMQSAQANQQYTVASANAFGIFGGIGASLGQLPTGHFMYGGEIPVPEKATPKAIAKRMVERLRAEIEEWHGDVLGRLVPA